MSIISSIILYFLLVHRACRSEPLAGWVEPASPNEFRFVVSIARKFDITANNPHGHVCGGALITRKYILTAASCFAVNRTKSDYHVLVGSNDLARSAKFEIASLTTYDSWHKTSRLCLPKIFDENDLAIIKLFDKVVAPARPAKKLSNLSPTDLEGKEVITAGWGLTFDDTAPQHLLKAYLRVINESQCLQNIRVASNDPTYEHESNIFCTNGVTLFAVLDEGDRGSPVFVIDENGDYRIVGINQRAAPLTNVVVRIPEQQNKHVSVQYYFDFIKLVIDIRRPLA